MAGKARVHELAKEFGVTSKEVLTKLKDLGEFVKSASSTVEAPVARRLRDAYGEANGSGKSAPAAPKPGGAPRPGPKPPARPAQPAQSAPEEQKPTTPAQEAPQPEPAATTPAPVAKTETAPAQR